MEEKGRERVIIVTFRLPIIFQRIETETAQERKWKFRWNLQNRVFTAFCIKNNQLKSSSSGEVGLGVDGKPIIWVGWPGIYPDERDQEYIETVLLRDFNCVPVFLKRDVVNGHYHNFCKQVLWKLYHFTVPLNSGLFLFDKADWRQYCNVNLMFQHKITRLFEDGDLIWVHDYHLQLLPSFLRRKIHDARIGFFFHTPFPSSEIYRTIPVREELLKGVLAADIIGFHFYDYARHFLVICSRLLGLETNPKGVEYCGRMVAVSIHHLGIDPQQSNEILDLLQHQKISFPSSVKSLIKQILPDDPRDPEQIIWAASPRPNQTTIILGLDELDETKGLKMKMLGFDQFLENHADLRDKLLLLQICYTAPSGRTPLNRTSQMGNSINFMNQNSSLGDELRDLVEKINNKYDRKVIWYDERIEEISETSLFCALADVLLLTSCRDGLNLLPYTFTVCQEYLKKAGVMVLSEFMGCSRSLSGALRLNPYDIEGISVILGSALKMSLEERLPRHRKHLNYINSHTASQWAKTNILLLTQQCLTRNNLTYVTLGMGLDTRVIGLNENFTRLDAEVVRSSFQDSKKRILLLNYDGTLSNLTPVKELAKPTKELLQTLYKLTNNDKTLVFLISSRDSETLFNWFGHIKGLGIVAESGFLIRWPHATNWQKQTQSDYDMGWKEMVESIFQTYTQQTDGSFLERKDSALTWNYQDSDIDFGKWQAKDLHSHLDNVLTNFNVDIVSATGAIEVKCQGFNKGSIVDTIFEICNMKRNPTNNNNNDNNNNNTTTHLPPQDLLNVGFFRDFGSTSQIDFILCMGDDTSDETMMIKCENFHGKSCHVYSCTIGNKPSKAKYWLNDPAEARMLLDCLVAEL